jgi:hypothetical protein
MYVPVLHSENTVQLVGDLQRTAAVINVLPRDKLPAKSEFSHYTSAISREQL